MPTRHKKARWIVFAAVFSFIAAFIAGSESLMVLNMIKHASAGAQIGILLPICFSFIMLVVGGLLMLRPGTYGRNSLAGASFSIAALALYVVHEIYNFLNILNLTTGWEGLGLIFPMGAMSRLAIPAVLITSIAVFVLSVKHEFSRTSDSSCPSESNRPTPQHRLQSIAVIVIFIIVMIAAGCAYGYKWLEYQKVSAEWEQMMADSKREWDAEAQKTFAETQFPLRGFSLEEHFDISKTDYGAGDKYLFVYRSEPTGLSWDLSEDPASEGKSHMAVLWTIFDEKSPLYGLDEFILIEKGGNYDFAYSCARESANRETYVILVDEIDKALIDSYTEDYINDIRTGNVAYTAAPRLDVGRDGDRKTARNVSNAEDDHQGGGGGENLSRDEPSQKSGKGRIGDEVANQLEERGFNPDDAQVSLQGHIELIHANADGLRWVVRFAPENNGEWSAYPLGFMPEKVLVLDSVLNVDEEKLRSEGFVLVWTDRLDATYLDNYFSTH